MSIVARVDPHLDSLPWNVFLDVNGMFVGQHVYNFYSAPNFFTACDKTFHCLSYNVPLIPDKNTSVTILITFSIGPKNSGVWKVRRATPTIRRWVGSLR